MRTVNNSRRCDNIGITCCDSVQCMDNKLKQMQSKLAVARARVFFNFALIICNFCNIAFKINSQFSQINV